MDAANRVQIRDEIVCISQSANTLGEGMNPIILSSAIGKSLVRLGFLTLVGQPVLEKENS